MKYLLLISLFFCSSYTLSDEGRLNRESNNYKYTSLGVHFIESEDSGFAINLSVDLPGSFYVTLERKADGVDYKSESYDKVVDSVRLGAHMGIGDLLGSISSGEIKFKIKNLFDVFAEVGIKTSDFDGERFNFEGNDSHASVLAGIRFGNSNSWEGKIFLDASKEAIIVDSGNPVCRALTCPPYDAKLSDETDKKFGISILYNINNRSAVFIEAFSSEVIDSTFKIGYQFNL
jgi:hypothetical protein|tara:strand:- start:1941 stop:2636 length:696 start_codon:yes stop_codon:yes gene_type:complete